MDIFMNAPERATMRVRLADIRPNPAQPRRSFSDETISSLAGSINEHGLLSPLLVRRIDAGKYELVAGERRLRALLRLEREWADAIVISAYDMDSALIALVENLQRESLHYLDEAEACRAILENHHITQDELAKKLGRSPSALANRLRLIRLSPKVKDALIAAGLTERHARALLLVENEESQLELIDTSFKNKLTVRQLEARIARLEKTVQKRDVKCVFRDMRLYVNAVMDTVSRLNSMGALADTQIDETENGARITIYIRAQTE